MLLATAVLAAGSAVAVERGDTGYGEVLVFPYAAGSPRHSTLLTLSPAVPPPGSGVVEAVAVRVVVHVGDPFTGQVASHPFTVVLGVNDSWTAVLHGQTGLQLSSNDPSCAWDPRGDRLDDAARLLSAGATEGWIEAYELGAITDSSLVRQLRTDGCDAFLALIAGRPVQDWLAPPDNRLRGNLQLVDHWLGAAFTLAPTALRNFRDAAWWQPPGVAGPTLADATPPVAVVQLEDGSRRASTFSAHPVDAVSAVLTDAAWEVEFSVQDAIAAQTDLLVLAPTWRWYQDGGTGRAPFAGAGGAAPTQTAAFDRDGYPEDPPGAKCTPVPPPIERFPGPDIAAPLLVLQFGEISLLDSRLAQPVAHVVSYPEFCDFEEGPLRDFIQAGRIVLDFDTGSDSTGVLRSDEGHTFHGLPVIGVGLTQAVGASLLSPLAGMGLVQPVARRTRRGTDGQ